MGKAPSPTAPNPNTPLESQNVLALRPYGGQDGWDRRVLREFFVLALSLGDFCIYLIDECRL